MSSQIEVINKLGQLTTNADINECLEDAKKANIPLLTVEEYSKLVLERNSSNILLLLKDITQGLHGNNLNRLTSYTEMSNRLLEIHEDYEDDFI